MTMYLTCGLHLICSLPLQMNSTCKYIYTIYKELWQGKTSTPIFSVVMDTLCISGQCSSLRMCENTRRYHNPLWIVYIDKTAISD